MEDSRSRHWFWSLLHLYLQLWSQAPLGFCEIHRLPSQGVTSLTCPHPLEMATISTADGSSAGLLLILHWHWKPEVKILMNLLSLTTGPLYSPPCATALWHPIFSLCSLCSWFISSAFPCFPNYDDSFPFMQTCSSH